MKWYLTQSDDANKLLRISCINKNRNTAKDKGLLELALYVVLNKVRSHDKMYQIKGFTPS